MRIKYLYRESRLKLSDLLAKINGLPKLFGINLFYIVVALCVVDSVVFGLVIHEITKPSVTRLGTNTVSKSDISSLTSPTTAKQTTTNTSSPSTKSSNDTPNTTSKSSTGITTPPGTPPPRDTTNPGPSVCQQKVQYAMSGRRYWIMGDSVLTDMITDPCALAAIASDTIYVNYDGAVSPPVDNLKIIPTDHFISEATFASDVQKGSIPSGIKAILYDSEAIIGTPSDGRTPKHIGHLYLL